MWTGFRRRAASGEWVARMGAWCPGTLFLEVEAVTLFRPPIGAQPGARLLLDGSS